MPKQLRLFGKKAVGEPSKKPAGRSLSVAGLFAGIGGIETGLARSGHQASLLCEIEPGARAVLDARLPEVPKHPDICTLKAFPKGTELATAGFPCQDLSQAGKTRGISGARSGLVGEVFRLIEKSRTPLVLLENVPFMLQLARGEALEVIVSALEHHGYKWAYRVFDSRAFGVPQRRERVLLLAALEEDPRNVLLVDDAGTQEEDRTFREAACGFYWTEGIRGLGWAVDAVPTLKGGSTIGIASPPAIIFPDGLIGTPDIRDAERMQGFPEDWTAPALEIARKGHRWKLVGNAVTVDLFEWVGPASPSRASSKNRSTSSGSWEDAPGRGLAGTSVRAVSPPPCRPGRCDEKVNPWPATSSTRSSRCPPGRRRGS